MGVEVVDLMDLINEESHPLKVEKVCRFTTKDRVYDYIVQVKESGELILYKTDHSKMNSQEMSDFIDQYLEPFVKGSDQIGSYDYIVQLNSDQDMVTIESFPTNEVLRSVSHPKKRGSFTKTVGRFENFRKR